MVLRYHLAEEVLSFEIAVDTAIAYFKMANDLCKWLRRRGHRCKIKTLIENREKCDFRFFIAPFHTTRHEEVIGRIVDNVEGVWITDTEGLPIFQSKEQLDYVNSLQLVVSTGSKFSANMLKEAGVSLPIKVVPRAVDHFEINAVKVQKGDYISFVAASYWGMKHQRKGIEEAYEAMRIVNKKYPKLRLYHLTTNHPGGIGIKIPNDANIQLDLNLGGKKYEEVIALIKGAKVHIAPSHCEGFNLPALEAMACRTPLVYTDVPAQNEFAVGVKVPVNGYEEELTKYGILNRLYLFSPEDLAEAILYVYENPSYAEELAEKAYEKSLEYDVNRVFPKYFEP